MPSFPQDIRYSLRALARQPGFTLIALLTLAIGIGSNTAIFGVFNTVLLRPLPYRAPDRLVWITEVLKASTADEVTVTADFLEWRRQNHVFSRIAAFNYWTRNLTGTGEPQQLQAAKASADLLPLLGVSPALGRNFRTEEDQKGQDGVAIISNGLRQRTFGGGKDVLGRVITLDGDEFTVVGVLPAKFEFPGSRNVDLITPLGKDEAAELKRGNGMTIVHDVIARLKPGVTLRQAQAELDVIQSRLAPASFMKSWNISARVLPLREHLRGNFRAALLSLVGAVGFLLLIACANVASLLLARAAARRRELAIRSALGAGRVRLLRQMLTESLVLASVSGLLGMLLAVWARDLLSRLISTRIPGVGQIVVDWRVLGYSFILVLLTAIVFTVPSALSDLRVSVSESLKSGGIAVAGSRGHRRWLHGLVSAEIAVALMLVIGAGLLLQSFWRMRYVNLGFHPDRILTASLQLSGTYSDPAARNDFLADLLQRAQNLPGVESAAITGGEELPPGGGHATNTFEIEGRAVTPNHRAVARQLPVSRDYFRVMGIPLIEGRLPADNDTANSAKVVFVSGTLARRYFSGEDPLGKHIQTAGPDQPWETIAGVVGDVKTAGLTSAPESVIYLPYLQTHGPIEAALLIRTPLDPAAIAPTLRNMVASADPNQPVAKIETMNRRLTESVAQPRFTAFMLALFAVLALGLAAIGIYGVMTCAVRWQTRDLGIRQALGAAPEDILRLVLGQGLRAIAVGIAIGLAGAVAMTRLLSGLLYQVRPLDPGTLVAASLFIAFVALLASYVPARHTLRIDAATALRHE
ncbi:MAG TPA: ABC transporter permease [Bryobacteraceae bacterium]|nr:ABC transporter permease [Bryobacteraceae bacterium]